MVYTVHMRLPRYPYNLKNYGGFNHLAKDAHVSRMTLWRALCHIKCGWNTAVSIEAATHGGISKSDLRPDIWPPKRTAKRA